MIATCAFKIGRFAGMPASPDQLSLGFIHGFLHDSLKDSGTRMRTVVATDDYRINLFRTRSLHLQWILQGNSRKKLYLSWEILFQRKEFLLATEFCICNWRSRVPSERMTVSNHVGFYGANLPLGVVLQRF